MIHVEYVCCVCAKSLSCVCIEVEDEEIEQQTLSLCTGRIGFRGQRGQSAVLVCF
jgi:hypothetical protein